MNILVSSPGRAFRKCHSDGVEGDRPGRFEFSAGPDCPPVSGSLYASESAARTFSNILRE